MRDLIDKKYFAAGLQTIFGFSVAPATRYYSAILNGLAGTQTNVLTILAAIVEGVNYIY
jgi:hypothetical protein